MIKEEDQDEFVIWFNNGVKRGWISSMFCDTHDGPPLNDEEFAELEEHGEICVHCVRIM
jgi:hypothetical protein